MTLAKSTSKILVVITFLGMIVVNALANILPINQTTTGDISNSYPNLFAPAALTFSIWGVIYTLLAAYTIFQTGLFTHQIKKSTTELMAALNPYYLASSLINMSWIFAWHYRQIGLSVGLMFGLLFCLKKISTLIHHSQLTMSDQILIRTPFSVYLGWITVATIANITTWLVSLNWSGFGLTDQSWTIIVLLIGAAIGLKRMLTDQNIAYGLVLIWAYWGIWLKHRTFFANQYPPIMTTVLICLGLFAFAIAKILFTARRHQPNQT